MKSTSYKIKLRGTVGNVTAVPTSIAWINGSDTCLVTPCYKENDYIVVELIPDCVGSSCIEGYVQFGDTCTNCEPLYFKRCFCSTDADCPSGCENCNEYGICQSKCLVGEFCAGDTCCECNATTPCTGNKICNGCKCVCPQGTFDKNGICVECDNNTILDKCHVCVNGTIVAIPCDGACDPSTGQCVDCLIGGDCSSRTDGKTCCVNKQCVCCAGTTWDATLEKCVPILCVDDASCNDPCLKCTPEGCKPIICPAGYKCYKGECVEWPCTSVSCDNGADCGPGCGCVVFEGIKQCVPCHILECEGLCEEALGCKCVNAKCEPVDNCGQYCDPDNPCTSPNCTCYNNQCVSCENFPCNPDDCSSRPNCGCTGGDCGGAACKDKLEIKKECGNNTNSCKLIANLTAEKGCKCDDIKFKTNILNTCTNDFNLLKIKTKLFKGLIEYNNFNHITIGDNEFVVGSIDTVVSHYNDAGVLIVPTGLTAVPSQPINTNEVGEIELTSGTHYKLTTISPTGEVRGNRIVIQLKAKGIKIPNNNCINYKDGTVIAEFEFNFLGAQSSVVANTLINCTKINTTYKEEQIKFLNDSISSKIPLFIWSKTSTNFPTTKFQSTNEYTNSGWFRKIYGLKVAGGYKDEISSPADLVNNYIYQVKVDCGCAEKATTPVTDFCCLPDLIPKLDNCNTELKLDPFTVCSVNGKITLSGVSEFNKAKYRVVIDQNGVITTKEIEFNTNTTTKPFLYSDSSKGPITSAKIERYFTGGLLKDTICSKDLPINLVTLPSPIIETDCDDMVTTYYKTYQVTGVVNIASVTITNKTTNTNLGTASFFNSDVFKTIGALRALVGLDDIIVAKITFNNGCFVELPVPGCKADIILDSTPDIYSKQSCSNPSTGPTLEITPIGFTSEVQYSVNGGPFESSNVFLNLSPGIYTVIAKETINGVEYIAEDEIEILPAKDISLLLTPSTICSGESSTLTVTAEPGVSIAITNPNGILIGNHTFTTTTYSIPGLTISGEYTVTVTNSDTFCNGSKNVTLNVGGGILTPTINITPGCIGTPIPFTIFDGNKNKSYRLTSSTGSVTTPLEAGVTGYYTPTVVNGSITITRPDNDCDTMVPITTPVNGNITSPIVTSVTTNCVGNTHTIVATITGATYVMIGGVVITPVGNVYTAVGIVGSSVLIEASNGVCTTERTEQLSNCNCPDYYSNIAITPPTCGQGSQNISFVNYAPIAIGKTYQLQKEINSVWTNVAGTNYSGTVPSNPGLVPIITVNNTIGVFDKYRMTISDGACTKESTNTVTTEAVLNETIYVSAPDNNTDIFYGTTGTPYAFTAVGTQPGTTYTWSGVPGINSSAEVSNAVSFTTPGTYTITLNTLYTGCPNSASILVEITQSCIGGPVVNVNNGTTGTCQNPMVTVSGGSGALTYAWYVDDVLEGTQTTNTFDAGLLIAGSSVSLKVVVTDANNCTGETTFPYTRCACQCITEVCKTEHNYQGSGGEGLIITTPEYPVGKILEFKVNTATLATSLTDRFKIVVENGGPTTILDTGYPFTVNNGGCPTINYPLDIVDLSSYSVNDPILPADFPSIPVNTVTLVQNTAVIILKMNYTTAAGDVIKVYHNDTLCTNQLGWAFTITCLN